MADRPRVFDFDVGVPMSDALRVIRAALEDEGLALGPRSGSMDQVTSVIVNGRQLFRVPLTRIWEPEAAAMYYRSLPPRHAFVPNREGSRSCGVDVLVNGICGQDRGHPVHSVRKESEDG